jgi:flagellar hook-associated protein 2
LDAALASNPDQVRELMIGTNGIVTQLKTMVDNALNLDPNSGGLFSSHTTSYQARTKKLNDSIAATQARLDQKEQLLRKQFSAMETAISQSQSQGNALSGLAAQLSANSKA